MFVEVSRDYITFLMIRTLYVYDIAGSGVLNRDTAAPRLE